jgi:hypothetical protein
MYDSAQSGWRGRATIAATMVHGQRGALPGMHKRITIKENHMGIGTLLLVLLVLALVGVLPTWGHSSNWGYGPSGGVGLIVVILVVLLVTGRI